VLLLCWAKGLRAPRTLGFLLIIISFAARAEFRASPLQGSPYVLTNSFFSGRLVVEARLCLKKSRSPSFQDSLVPPKLSSRTPLSFGVRFTLVLVTWAMQLRDYVFVVHAFLREFCCARVTPLNGPYRPVCMPLLKSPGKHMGKQIDLSLLLFCCLRRFFFLPVVPLS